MTKLKLVEKLKTPVKRGQTPLALSDAGVLVAEQGDDDAQDETAIELINPDDHFDPLPEVEQNLPFHLYAVCASGGGKSTYVGKLAERFKDLTQGEGTVIVFFGGGGSSPRHRPRLPLPR